MVFGTASTYYEISRPVLPLWFDSFHVPRLDLEDLTRNVPAVVVPLPCASAFPISPSQIPVDRTELIPVSLDLGFELHHAEKEYVMLNM